MIHYLLDTSIISAFAPRRIELTDELRAWSWQAQSRLHISVISVAELQQGVAKLRRIGAQRRVEEFQSWIDGLLSDFSERLLVVDQEAAIAAGEMVEATVAAGRIVDFGDIYIAATAKVHGLTILTRNVKHFAATGVPYLDPLITLPR